MKRGNILIWGIMVFIGLSLFIAGCVTTPETQQQRKPKRKNCLECHTELVQKYQSGIVHEPVRSNNCFKCHLSHGIVGALLLREYPPGLCFRCHQGTKVKMLQEDNVASGNFPNLEDIGIQPNTIDAVVPEYLRRYRRGGGLNSIAAQ